MCFSNQHGDSKQFLCKCSFLEIYNEQIFDLMEPTAIPLHLRESFKTGVYVAGLAEKVVADASEAYGVGYVIFSIQKLMAADHQGLEILMGCKVPP